jgi:hypothetical protein
MKTEKFTIVASIQTVEGTVRLTTEADLPIAETWAEIESLSPVSPEWVSKQFHYLSRCTANE